MVIQLWGCTYKITHIVVANYPRLSHKAKKLFFTNQALCEFIKFVTL